MSKIPPNIKIKMRKADVGRSAADLDTGLTVLFQARGSGERVTKVHFAKAAALKSHFGKRIAVDSAFDQCWCYFCVIMIFSGAAVQYYS